MCRPLSVLVLAQRVRIWTISGPLVILFLENNPHIFNGDVELNGIRLKPETTSFHVDIPVLFLI